jgi:hypothetical protein
VGNTFTLRELFLGAMYIIQHFQVLFYQFELVCIHENDDLMISQP